MEMYISGIWMDTRRLCGMFNERIRVNVHGKFRRRFYSPSLLSSVLCRLLSKTMQEPIRIHGKFISKTYQHLFTNIQSALGTPYGKSSKTHFKFIQHPVPKRQIRYQVDQNSFSCSVFAAPTKRNPPNPNSAGLPITPQDCV